MNAGTYATLLVIFLLLLLAFLLGVMERRRIRKQLRHNLRARFGKQPPARTDQAYLLSLPQYYQAQAEVWEAAGEAYLDDITWNDCEMDDVFRRIDGAQSAPGAEALYAWLRKPLLEELPLTQRDELIEFFGSRQDAREAVQLILSDVGFTKRASFYEHIMFLKTAKSEGVGKYILLLLCSIIAIALLFVRPLFGSLLLLPVMGINLYVYFKDKEKLQMHAGSFAAILRLLEAAGQIIQLGFAELAVPAKEMEEALASLGTVRRGGFIVANSAQVGTGLADMFLEYVSMFFHLDQLFFHRLLKAVHGHEDELVTLFARVGELDAAICCASYRACLPQWCKGELEVSETAFVEAEAVVHPRLTEGVPNDYALSGGNLITGSNASGKSTFLKSVAIAAILAQTIATVPAKRYRASYLRVYTSMALRDAMQKGESYFIVEIKSIKRMLDAAASSTPLLCVVDEVLRGTNTVERIAASAQILNSLQSERTLVVAATHDLELGKILSSSYRNLHFSEEMSDGDVHFSYKLQEGAATSRNAILLLEKAGYDQSIVQAAEAAASHFEATGQWQVLSEVTGEG